MDAILHAIQSGLQTTEFAAALPSLRVVFVLTVVFAMSVVIAPEDVLADIRTALRKAGISDKEFAADAGFNKGIASEKLSGGRPLTIPNLANQRVEFWQRWAIEIAVRVGVPKDVRVGSRLRQARMTLNVNRREGAA